MSIDDFLPTNTAPRRPTTPTNDLTYLLAKNPRYLILTTGEFVDTLVKLLQADVKYNRRSTTSRYYAISGEQTRFEDLGLQPLYVELGFKKEEVPAMYSTAHKIVKNLPVGARGQLSEVRSLALSSFEWYSIQFLRFELTPTRLTLKKSLTSRRTRAC